MRDFTHVVARNVATRSAPKVLSMGGSESTGGIGLQGMTEDTMKGPAWHRDWR